MPTKKRSCASALRASTCRLSSPIPVATNRPPPSWRGWIARTSASCSSSIESRRPERSGKARYSFGMRIGVALAVCVLTSGHAWAQDDAAIAQARESYDRGAAAYDARDYGKAATELARADELVPNATVLELALQAAVRARDAATAMELVPRVEKRVPEGAPLFAAARSARAELARDAGTITTSCPPPFVFCTATIDGRLATIGTARWVPPGEHTVEMTADGVPDKQTVRVAAGGAAEVRPAPKAEKPTTPPSPAPAARPAPPPPAPTPPTKAESRGLSPVWFWAGTGLTVSLGAVTLWSGLDTQSKHDAFTANPSLASATEGRDAQLRTNILGVVTVAAA